MSLLFTGFASERAIESDDGIWTWCHECAGVGEVESDDQDVTCPTCIGRGGWYEDFSEAKGDE